MLSFQLYHPTRVIFGNDTLEVLANEVKKYGNRALLVTRGTSLKQNGTIERVLKLLAKEKIPCELFEEIHTEPSFSDIANGFTKGKSFRADIIIGLGGGSAIDSAKAIAACLKSNATIESLIKADSFDALPVIAIPTTAGTGSELSRGAILTDEKKQIKTGLRGDELIPKVALIDPQLTYSMSPSLTALTGFDAFAHAVESFLSTKSNLYTSMLSLEAIRDIYTYLPQAYSNPSNSEARTYMSYASMLMGYNLVYASTGLPHRIQYSFGTLPGMSHALGLSILYDSWLNLATHLFPEKMKEVALAMGLDRSQLKEKNWDKKFLTKFSQFKKNLGLEKKLTDFGVTKKDIVLFASKVTGNLDMDPTYKGESTIKKILQESL